MKKLFLFFIALCTLSVSAWATTIEWTASDLETVNVEMGYNTAPGESQTIKGITVTNNTCYQCGDYCHFEFDNDPRAQYCGFSMRDNGQLVFAPEFGKLTSIVIHWNYEGPDPDLVPGSGWVFSESQLTWTSATAEGASSVVLKSNSSNPLASGPITLIEFTVSGYDPDGTWAKTDLAGIQVGNENGVAAAGTELTQTVKDITVSANASAPVTEWDWNAAQISGDEEYGGYISLAGDGTLTFAAPEGKLLAGIVITYNGNSESPVGMAYLDGAAGWSWDENTYKITWSGDAASSVVLAYTSTTEAFAIPQIQSIVFIIEEIPDTREVPELKFYNDLTEATIVLDDYGWTFEPGTDYEPPTSYSIFIKDGVFYYEGQPYENWRSPSELEDTLIITYSLSNDEVIELTSTWGDNFSFVVKPGGFGDVVVTASTVGNTRFQPASITFTIHVIEGKAPTRECVLSFEDGSIVPDDYEFNMETGDEFVNLTLREKNNPYHPVYAPSFSMWGSKNYYIASLAGEKKLRALTAGTDTFTVRYARYQTGDAEGKFRILKFPVHIKPSKPAMTSSLSLTSNPASSSSLVCNAEYDGTAQTLKINGALTNEEVRYAMENYAYGSPEWKAALPNTISFELAAGEGDFSVTCQVLDDNYEVRVLRVGDAIARRYDNPTLETFNIHYNIATQKAVVIYVAAKTSPNDAPRRAHAAKQDAEPLAMLSALDMAPTYPVEAIADPDHAGVYYCTHYNETQKYQIPAGAEAYVAIVSGNDLNLTKVAEGEQVIPADMAIILKSNAASIILTPTDAEAVTVSASNDLIGTDSEKNAPDGCYALNNAPGIGFYPFSETLAAHTAYITYDGAIAPERMQFVFDGETTTSIEGNEQSAICTLKRIENGQLIIIRNGERYNAQGQIVK